LASPIFTTNIFNGIIMNPGDFLRAALGIAGKCTTAEKSLMRIHKPPISAGHAAVSKAPPVRRGLIAPEILPALMVFAATVILVGGHEDRQPLLRLVNQLIAILVTAIFLVVASFGQGSSFLLGGIDLSLGVVIGIGGMMIAGLTRGSDDALLMAIPATLFAAPGSG